MVIFIVLILPLLNLGMGYAIQLWDQSYITEKNFISFLTNPPTLLLLFLALLIVSYFLLLQLITMIHYCNSEKANQKPNILHLLLAGLRKTRRYIITGNIALPVYTIFLFLFTNLPLLLVVTSSIKLDFPGGAASDEVFVKGLLFLVYLLLGYIVFRGLFVLHFCLNEHQSFPNAVELSKALLQGRSLSTLQLLISYNFGLIISYFIIYYVILFLVALFVFFFAEKSMVITVFLSVYPNINRSINLLFPMIAFLTNINLITTLYTRYRNEEFQDILSKNPPYQKPLSHIRNKKQENKNKHTTNAFLIFVIIIGLINFYLTVRNDSFYLADTLSGIQISSHRGNSHVAPENTLPALENAILARSDYAEIDVRQTKDGVLVLLHDINLLRTSGLNENIWSLDLIDILKLDVGSWFSPEFIKTQIPTLEEVLIHCKGRIKLNIELKSNAKDNQLEENLIALIAKYDYEHQCLISSSNYDTLVKVKQLNSNLKTGLIMSAAYGNFYDNKNIDFFSIRSRFITRQVVESAHRVGKEVHAWTVNSVNEIDRMRSIGVDCIITDNPTLTREILTQDDTTKTFIELLRRMLSGQTFYSLLPD
jgi:glycerophosphoryl diester phosphodiesterase